MNTDQGHYAAETEKHTVGLTRQRDPVNLSGKLDLVLLLLLAARLG